MKKKIHRCLKHQGRTAWAALGCLLLLLLYGCADASSVRILDDSSETIQDFVQEDLQDQNVVQDELQNERQNETCTVYVCGAVVHPGVYTLDADSRIYQALALAGGLTDEAAENAVNQAELLTDGEMIEIPTADELSEQQAQAKEQSDGLVNINTADLEELKTLPGIGDSRARSIIAYRESHGAFTDIQEVKNIDGIGDGTFAKLEGCIKVE
jgi:competence protein ComEA